jgi:hypothetical protein
LLRERLERHDRSRHVCHLAAQVGYRRAESTQEASRNALVDPTPFALCSHSGLQDAIKSKVIFRCTEYWRLVTEKVQNPPYPFDVPSHRFSFFGFPRTAWGSTPEYYLLRSHRFTGESVINCFRWEIGNRSNEVVKIAHSSIRRCNCGPRWLCARLALPFNGRSSDPRVPNRQAIATWKAEPAHWAHRANGEFVTVNG